MLPGSVSKLYRDDEIMVHLEPLARWSAANYIQKKVVKVQGNENRILLQDGTFVDYDVLALNVGSKTRGSHTVPGVWEHSLTTRPINDLLPKIRNKENDLKWMGIVPEVVICGAGAAGVELAFAFKARWTQFFGQEVKVTVLGARDRPLHTEPAVTIEMIESLFKKYNIKFEQNCRVKEVTKDSVVLEDGREFKQDAAIWATGAEA
jgi:selenide,water dikinase